MAPKSASFQMFFLSAEMVKGVLSPSLKAEGNLYLQKVKEKVIEKEHHEWIATGLMYQSVKEFKSLEVSIKTGCHKILKLITLLNIIWFMFL